MRLQQLTHQAQFLAPPPHSSLTSLTYFPSSFKEHIQEESQEHRKVSEVAFPCLIAVPPSINTSPRLPPRQHLLTSLRQEARPACVAPSCFQGSSLGSLGTRKCIPVQVQSC